MPLRNPSIRRPASAARAWSNALGAIPPSAARSWSAAGRRPGFQTSDPFLKLGNAAVEDSNVAIWVARCSGRGRGPWRGARFLVMAPAGVLRATIVGLHAGGLGQRIQPLNHQQVGLRHGIGDIRLVQPCRYLLLPEIEIAAREFVR